MGLLGPLEGMGGARGGWTVTNSAAGHGGAKIRAAGFSGFASHDRNWLGNVENVGRLGAAIRIESEGYG
jgi:hypothetical protein